SPLPTLSLHDALPISWYTLPKVSCKPSSPLYRVYRPIRKIHHPTVPPVPVPASHPPHFLYSPFSQNLPVGRRPHHPGRHKSSERSEEHTSELQSRFEL